jgi:hypothetical protein
MNHYISFELSKKLKENGCKLKNNRVYSRYDILWDICIKYSKEFWGNSFRLRLFVLIIIVKFLEKESREEIEQYIWDNCLFNPKNKEEKCKI